MLIDAHAAHERQGVIALTCDGIANLGFVAFIDVSETRLKSIEPPPWARRSRLERSESFRAYSGMQGLLCELNGRWACLDNLLCSLEVLGSPVLLYGARDCVVLHSLWALTCDSWEGQFSTLLLRGGNGIR